MIPEITPAELAAWRNDAAREAPFVLDVREPWEFDRASLPGASLIPMREIPARLAELPSGRDIVVMCHHGGRSASAAQWLAGHGFPRVHNLAGGIDAWSRTVDASVPRY